MAEASTIARPYARAVFEKASEENRLSQWSAMLSLLAEAVGNDELAAVIASKQLDKSELAALIIDICGDGLDEEGRNLVRLLAENGRLQAVPEIAARYEALRAEAESTIDAELRSALPVDDSARQKLAEALGKRLGRKVNLNVTIDESLVGGAVIRAGDMVIDGSASGKLNKLAAAMNQ